APGPDQGVSGRGRQGPERGQRAEAGGLPPPAEAGRPGPEGPGMRPELLAPAGSPEALRAAVQNGADAVYLGWGAFNARRGAKNFSDEEFAAAL
ncbi:hypothetical protein HEAFMP_HEAFMP_13195, partial [Dysosmobacter welbionis]